MAALDFDGQVYLLADHSDCYPMNRWAALVISLCESRRAACVATGHTDIGKVVGSWLGQLDPSVSVQLKRLTYDGCGFRANPITRSARIRSAIPGFSITLVGRPPSGGVR